MVETPLTRLSLPTRTADETGTEVRQKLVRLYAPVVYAHARRRGLGDADAVLVLQQVLRGVARDDDGLDSSPDRGTLDRRFFTLSCRAIATITSTRSSRALRPGNGGPRVDPEAGRTAEPDADWEAEVTRRLVAEAVSRAEGEFPKSTWQAFWLTAIEGQPAPVVGRQLRMSAGAVLVAKCRVIARLGSEVRSLRAEVEGWSWSAN